MREKTMEKPRQNNKALETVFLALTDSPLEISCAEMPEIIERYPGRSGKTQGVKKLAIPAAKTVRN
jgi:hypothetical protein